MVYLTPPSSTDKPQKKFPGVKTAELRLHCVSHTLEYVFRSVRYTGKTFAEQIKPATALEGTILQKSDTNHIHLKGFKTLENMYKKIVDVFWMQLTKLLPEKNNFLLRLFLYV